MLMKIVYDNSKKIYAYRTTVSKYKSMADIRELLEKFGAKGWVEIDHPAQNIKIIQFQIKDLSNSFATVHFEVPEVYYKNKKINKEVYLENESYRLLYIIIKTKLLLAEYTDVLEAFLPNLLMENGVPLLKQVNTLCLLMAGNNENEGK